jgi:hypothetical protein
LGGDGILEGMNFRVCDSGREQVMPASLELVEHAFAPDATIKDAMEISLAEGDRWIAALAVGPPGPGEFLVTGADGDRAAPSGRVGRDDALRRFREFMSA